MSWSKSDWERLGDYVTAGRLRVDMSRYDLAAGADLSVRTLADIENGELGKRKAFSAETLEAIGACLRWKPGSWRRILNGDEPLVDEDAPAPTSPDEPRFDEVAEMAAGIMPALDRLSSAERKALSQLIDTFAHRDLLDEAPAVVGGMQIPLLPMQAALESDEVRAALVEWAQTLRSTEGLEVKQLTVIAAGDDPNQEPRAYRVDVMWQPEELDVADDYDLAARRGVSEGKQRRRDQDEAGEESQDNGGEG